MATDANPNPNPHTKINPMPTRLGMARLGSEGADLNAVDDWLADGVYVGGAYIPAAGGIWVGAAVA